MRRSGFASLHSRARKSRVPAPLTGCRAASQGPVSGGTGARVQNVIHAEVWRKREARHCGTPRLCTLIRPYRDSGHLLFSGFSCRHPARFLQGADNPGRNPGQGIANPTQRVVFVCADDAESRRIDRFDCFRLTGRTRTRSRDVDIFVGFGIILKRFAASACMVSIRGLTRRPSGSSQILRRLSYIPRIAFGSFPVGEAVQTGPIRRGVPHRQARQHDRWVWVRGFLSGILPGLSGAL